MYQQEIVVTFKERPDLKNEFDVLHSLSWEKYMSEDPVTVKYWSALFTCFPEYQFILLNDESEPVACGNSIPFHWDGNNDRLPSGWDDVFEKGVLDFENQIQPNSLSALAIVIHPDYRGQGLSEVMLREMKRIAMKGSLKHMVAPVRPSLKSKYPLIPMDEYIRWTRADGTPFDSWIRTHDKLGASIIKIAEKSMVIPASIKDWESWTDLKLPSSGSYVISGGLVPLEVNKEADTAVYIEPNVWMKHDLEEV
jgi:GNAT superfamily N-acetyltransferase